MNFWFVLKRLSLGIMLIAAAAAVLLVSDVRSKGSMPHIAILQHASVAAPDDSVRGMIDGLAENGYRDGVTLTISQFNAQGEVSTANSIARELVEGNYDLILTSSTLSMQAVANANKAGKARHIFGLVADPYVTGVAGLDPANPLAHPAHLTGYGILLPVDDAFLAARRLLPSLRSVGVAWNPSEANSAMFVGKARKICAELGITLIEAQVENSAGVREATDSLISRGAQAIWMGGDIAVSSAAETVVSAARQARIPVFSILPGSAERGTLFDLGVDFYQAGRLSGELAAHVLHGADPALIPIRDAMNVVPRQLLINLRVLKGLKDPWQVPRDFLAEANTVVDESGVHQKSKDR